MKIEIDLDNILGDESGVETLQESIRRQVIESITQNVKKGIKIRIDEAVGNTIQTELNSYLKEALPVLFAQIMDAEYTPVSTYGAKGDPTTLRATLLKSITDNMVYRKGNYSSDNNAFTKAVDSVMEEQLKAFKADFNKTVDATFTAAAFAHAREAIQKKLNIS